MGQKPGYYLTGKESRFILLFILPKRLARDIKEIVCDYYKRYSITSVANVEQANRYIWFINLADRKNYITASVEDGEMQEIEKFNKANENSLATPV